MIERTFCIYRLAWHGKGVAVDVLEMEINIIRENEKYHIRSETLLAYSF